MNGDINLILPNHNGEIDRVDLGDVNFVQEKLDQIQNNLPLNGHHEDID